LSFAIFHFPLRRPEFQTPRIVLIKWKMKNGK